MKSVLIIAGAYGYKLGPGRRVTPKTHADGPISLDDDEAARLVSIGVAEYYDAVEDAEVDASGVATVSGGEDDGKAGENTTGADAGAEGEETGGSEDDDPPPDKPEYDAETSADDLRELMKECGLTFKVGMTKVDMVEALDQYFKDGEDDGEDKPDLSPEDPQ